MKQTVLLFLQKPPRQCWCVRLWLLDGNKDVSLKTWFDEYTEKEAPPPSHVVNAALEELRRIGAVVLAGLPDEG